MRVFVWSIQFCLLLFVSAVQSRLFFVLIEAPIPKLLGLPPKHAQGLARPTPDGAVISGPSAQDRRAFPVQNRFADLPEKVHYSVS
jgi:hypothetical protein